LDDVSLVATETVSHQGVYGAVVILLTLGHRHALLNQFIEKVFVVTLHTGFRTRGWGRDFAVFEGIQLACTIIGKVIVSTQIADFTSVLGILFDTFGAARGTGRRCS
jgi:hypothetical protein